MCGRYAAAKDTATLVEEFAVEAVIDEAPAPNFNVAPTNSVALVVDRPVDDGHIQRQLRRARWGLVPSWAKDPSIGSRMINARWENAAEKPAFRSAFAKRRCLVPADGYFEWYTPATAAGARPRKQPYFIHRADGTDLALAGLYEFWRPSPQDDWLVTVTVLTTDSVGPLAAIHDRMPVVIDPTGYGAWLDPTARVDAGFGARMPAELLTAYPVSVAVNSVRNNSPALLDPIPLSAEDGAPHEPGAGT